MGSSLESSQQTARTPDPDPRVASLSLRFLTRKVEITNRTPLTRLLRIHRVKSAWLYVSVSYRYQDSKQSILEASRDLRLKPDVERRLGSAAGIWRSACTQTEVRVTASRIQVTDLNVNEGNVIEADSRVS